MGKNSNVLVTEGEAVCRMHYLMGTFVQIEVIGEERARAVESIEAAFSEMRRIESILSKYSEESEIFKINRFAHLFPLEIQREVFQLLREAIELSHLTKEAFDISVGGIIQLWDSAQKKGVIPAKEDLEKILVNYNDIILDLKNDTVFFKNPQIKIDLGGIGKGYAIDRAVDVLKKKGIKKALVNASGNIFCLDEVPSPIGIKNPLKNNDDIIATILLKDRAVSTSANYERFFSIEGKNYGHIINPKTGFPMNNGVLSVSVISTSAKVADSLSTAVFVLGLDEGMQLIEDINDLEGIIITMNDRRAKLYISSGLKEISLLTYIPN